MIPPATILRDACLAGLVLTIGGLVADPAFGGAVAAGALGAIVNLGLLVRLVTSAGTNSGVFLARLALKQLAGIAILAVLAAKLPVAPVLLGFCAVILALSVRAVFGVLRPVPFSPPPLEHG
jgi:hypothetical protein